ncbi:MAG: hypothetical protein V4685_12575 [Bacteroidota bacterium]
MKKIFGLALSAIAFTVISCANEPETTKEVIVVPAAPAPVEKKEPVVTVKDTPATSITLDKKGIEVKTKEVKVDIKP